MGQRDHEATAASRAQAPPLEHSPPPPGCSLRGLCVCVWGGASVIHTSYENPLPALQTLKLWGRQGQQIMSELSKTLRLPRASPGMGSDNRTREASGSELSWS